MRLVLGLVFLAVAALCNSGGALAAGVTYTITNGGVDTKDSGATGQVHLHKAGGHHDGDEVAWADSGNEMQVPDGSYDVMVSFEDGAATKTIWLDRQNLTGTVAKTVEIGLPVADASYTVTNKGEDTKDSKATGQFHLHPAGHHDGSTIAWGDSDGHVRLPAGHYDVEITFEDGAAHKTVWLDNQDITGTVTGSVEIGMQLADVSYTITSNGVDTKDTKATGQFHLHPAGHHDGSTIAWGDSGGHVRVPAGDYDVEITFEDGAAHRVVWLDHQTLSGTVTRTVEAGVTTADVSYTITNNGVDTKGTKATGQFHLHPAGHHDGRTVAWGDSEGHVRVPAGDYDVEITFTDGAAHRVVWLDHQALSGTVARSVEAGVPIADVSYIITNNGVDTKGSKATGQFHLHPAGHHDGPTVAWGDSDGRVRVPAGDYDVQITFTDGASHRVVWLDHQALSGEVRRTVEAGVPTADVSYTITNNGEDTKGTRATGQFHLHPAGHHDGPTIAWGDSDGRVRVPAGGYDVELTFSQGFAHKQIWSDRQSFSGTVDRTVEMGVVFTKPTVSVTRDGQDLGDKASVTYYGPGGRPRFGDVRSGKEALLEQGKYDILASFEDAEGWLHDQTVSGAPHLTIAIAKPKVQTLTAGAPPPKACTIEVYGVNFDFDKAVLRPESEPVLDQVLALFTANKGFAAEVGGHTDNVGATAYNARLSQARAESVKHWLVSHGVAANRVTAHGYGDTQPLVPNINDENRFRNRRVELRRKDCK